MKRKSPNFDVIPAELQSLPHWLIWRYEKCPRDKKPRKVPYYVGGQRRHGTNGSEADRKKLATFDKVTAAYGQGGYDGIGLAMLPEAGIVALDLDDCIADETLTKSAEKILRLAGDTYVERSPSGEGLRIFLRGERDDKKNNDAGVELFHAKGFVTVTGDCLGDGKKLGALSSTLRIKLNAILGPEDASDLLDVGDAKKEVIGLSEAEAKSMLAVLNADCRYKPWLDIGMALQSALGQRGFELWDEWSSRSDTGYPGREELADKWRSFKPDGGITAGTLRHLAREAGWRPSVNEFSPIGEAEWPEPLDLATLANQEPSPPKFIMDNWLPVGYASLQAGHGGTGKSAIALTVAVSIAADIPFFGVPVERRRVLYWSCEDRAGVLHWRLRRICAHLKVDLASLEGHLFIFDLVGQNPILWERDPRTGSTATPAYQQLAEMVRRHDIELLIIDGVADTFAGNENARGEVKRYINSLLSLVPADRGAVLLLHHVDKAMARSGSTAEGYSGSTSWHNSVRSRWFLHSESSGRLLLDLQKSNHGGGNQQMQFRWDPDGHLFVGEPVMQANNEFLEIEERNGLLRALKACADKGTSVPAATTGQRTAFHVLSHALDFPASLKQGRPALKRFWSHIEHLRSIGHVQESSIRRADRHITRTLVLTAAGEKQACGECGQ